MKLYLAAGLLLVPSCGAAQRAAPTPSAITAEPPDAGTNVSSVVRASTPPTCAEPTDSAHTPSSEQERRLGALATQERDAGITENQRWTLRYERALLLFEAARYEEAIALARALTFEGPSSIAEPAAVVYISALHAAGKPCLEVLRRDLPAQRSKLCGGVSRPRAQACADLTLMENNLAFRDALVVGNFDAAKASIAFAALFARACAADADRRFDCGSVAYNAVRLAIEGGRVAEARAMLGRARAVQSISEEVLRELGCLVEGQAGSQSSECASR